MIDKFKETFKEEAQELLSTLEDNLLALEERPTDPELISAVFRVMHTIKGSAAMFGFEEISHFTHNVESVMDKLREGKIRVSKLFIDLTLESRDLIREMLEDEEGQGDFSSRTEIIVERFKGISESAERKEAEKENAVKRQEEVIKSAVQKEELDNEVTYRIRFKPDPKIFMSGTNPLFLLKEVRNLGVYSCVPNLETIPPLDTIDPEKAYCSWDIIITTKCDLNTLHDIFIFVESDSEVTIEMIEDYTSTASLETPKKLGEILIERGVVEEEVIDQALRSQKKIGEVLLSEKVVSPQELSAALEEQEHVRKIQDKKNSAVTGSVRVSSDKLDALVDLVGELVTLQARISQVSLIVHDTQLTSMSEQLERLTADLRDNAMTLRMLPIGTTFSKFKRLVRDLSDDLGKKIEMETSGAETELDKTVIEKLNDPLIHLIRNCIDHGIETPDVRAKAGKSETGTIKLSALHSGASVIITVEDDGAGLNRKAILSKAIQRGIVGPDDELSDEELCCMIFAPGFSTAQKVTSVSGRGVGMDVVKKEIESLGGFVTVKSEEGKNTRVILSIPLTLAIIEGFLVKVGSDFYVLPLSSVEACIELTQEERAQHKGRRIINFRNEILSYVRLRDVFEIEGDEREIEQIVVVRSLDMRVGFVVDQVIGDYQTVIKSLGRIYKDVEGVSGATILGDGTVALILDINKLADIAHREETAELRR